MIWYLNSKLDLYLSCAKDFRSLNSIVTWCINWRRLLAPNYKKIGYNINILQQTACLVVNSITVGNFDFLFNCTSVGRTSDSMTVPTWRLISWWDGRGLMLWLFVRPTRVYCIQFYLLLSPCLCFISFLYLDLYVLGDDALISWGLSCKPNIYVSWSTSEIRVRLAPWNRFKPSSNSSKAVFLLWINFVSYASCWCVLCCRVCSL